jgi:cytochrome P450
MDETTDKAKITVDFDHYDQESAYDPFPRWKRMRDQTPVAWTEKHGGYYVLTRYNDIMEATRDTKIFSSYLNGVTIPRKPVPNLPPNEFDAPEHGIYRRIVNPLFSPERVATNRPWIRAIADSYTERLLAQDSFDVSIDLAMKVTQDVTQRLLGIVSAPEDMKRCAEDLVLMRGSAEEAGRKLRALLAAEIDKRRTALGDDVISTLLTASYDGKRPLTDDEIINTSLLVLLAGLDTTTSAIGGAVLYLIERPDVQKELAEADERTWRLALDEFVRWTSPAACTGRTVSQDTVFHGCPMEGKRRALLVVASGNRDSTEFPDPDKVILNRFPNRHMGFGIGPHRCLGSHVAKAELHDVLKGLLKGLGNFRLKDPKGIKWEASNVRGIRSMLLVRK